MATRQELVAGFEFTVSQAKRTTSLFAAGEWDWKRAAGWTPKEVYSHLATIAGIVPGFVDQISAAPPDVDPTKGIDINALNDQGVKAMASMTPQQVMQAFEANYQKLIDWVNSLPDERLAERRSFLSDPIPLSDILANSIMLHGVHHVYEANNRFESPV